MTFENAKTLLKMIGEGNLTNRGKTAIEVAKLALDKQIPKAPIYGNERTAFGGIQRICSECGDEVFLSPMTIPYENYCRYCGKRFTINKYFEEEE